MPENTKTIGERTEAVIIARFLLNGEVVLQPFGDNQRYDLVLDRGGEFVRVQCKTGRLKENGVINFKCASNSGHAAPLDYRGQADVFAVYCPETKGVYVVPVGDAPKRTCDLRVNPPKRDGPNPTRWADDYRI